jgi:hypothetical protein
LRAGGQCLLDLNPPSESNLCTEDTHCNYFFRVPPFLIIFNDCGKSDTLENIGTAREKSRFCPTFSNDAYFFHSTQIREWRQLLLQSFAVRSIADFSLATISSTSPSRMIKGGAKTIVSRIARQMRPSSKQ